MLTALQNTVASRASKVSARRGLEATQSTLPPTHSENGVVAARPNTKAGSSGDANHLRLAVAARHGDENRVTTVE